jgi:hypothetical protein
VIKKIIFISAAVLLLFVGGGVGILLSGKKGKKKVRGEPSACEVGNEVFTHLPVDLDTLDSITPLGNLNPSGHTFPTDHIYLNIKKGRQNIPVYAPGEVWVTGIDTQEKRQGDQSFWDYSINFEPCPDLKVSYAHINTLSKVLQDEFDRNLSQESCVEEETGGNRFRTCFADMRVKLSAGEVMGTTGKKGQINFDLDMNDLRHDTSWVREYTKWGDWRSGYLTAVCPLDYFTSELKETLYSFLGDFGGARRSIEPLCGTVAQDVWGTAQGVWFLAGYQIAERVRNDEHLALVHDNVDPTVGSFSIGISLEEKGLPSSTYRFTPKHNGMVNRDFDEVTPDGKIYCYVASGGYSGQHRPYTILIKLVNESTLRVGKFNEGATCGSGPWEFRSGYVDFER